MASIIKSSKKSCRILVNDQQRVAQKYRHFKALLEHNRECMQLISALESLYYRGEGFDRAKVRDLLDRLKTETAAIVESLNRLSNGRYPELEALPESIGELEKSAGKNVRVAVRSSAVGEDTASSFAGQYHTELNVSKENLIAAYKKVVASRFTPRAIQYRRRYGFDEEDTRMGVACLSMVAAVASGVVYTVDPVEPDSGMQRIAAVAGMGERLVSGEASPVTFFLEKNSRRVVRIEASQSEEDNERISKVIDNETLMRLCGMAAELETYFGAPQDIEWATDERGDLFVLQSRPLGLQKSETLKSVEQTHLKEKPVLLSGGLTASPGIASGTVCRALNASDSLPEGDWTWQSDSQGGRLVQDGSKWASRFSLGLAKRFNRMMGAKYQHFLDNIQAYFYFPLAVSKDGYIASGTIRVAVMPVNGLIDQAGGIAFGIQNIGNYFVFRLNSLEDNLILFEYVNSRRLERQAVACPLTAGHWYPLKLDIADRRLTACIAGEPVMSYEADRSLAGYVGLWTKADSVTWFKDFEISGAGPDARLDLLKDVQRTQTEKN